VLVGYLDRVSQPEMPTKGRPFRPADSGPERPCLVVLTGSKSGELLALGPGTTVIGRGADARLLLDDEGVSRAHAKIVIGPDGIVILHDLDSTNGVFVNGARQQRIALREGDRIQIGPDVTLKLTYRTDVELTGPRVDDAPPLPLSPRELEVAEMVADGLSNAEIAARLHISPRTVGTHLTNIYERLQVSSRTALARTILERNRGGRA
jgi:DNA-binding CsgD family transcriptional regulator